MPRILSQEEIDAQFGGGFRADIAPAGQGTRFGAAIDRAQAGLLGIGEAAGLPLGDLRRQNQFDQEQSMQRFFRDNPNEPQSYKDVEGVGSALRYARGLAIDSSPELLTSLATGGAGALMGLGTAGRVGLAAASNYPAAMGDILQNQREEAGQTNFGVAGLLAVPYAAADLVGLDAALAGGKMMRTGIKRLDEMRGFGGAAARTGANVAMNAPIEGASETFQELVNQAGRIAVNPNQTMFNPDANERYLESFIGGAALGGVASGVMGGWKRSEGYQAPQQEADLLNPTTRPETQPQQYGLVTQPAPLQQRIDQQLGIGARTTPKNYAKHFEEAYNEPSGQYATDPTTGLEKQLSVGEYQQLTGASLDLTESKPAEAAAATAVNAKIERDPKDLFIRDTLKVIPNQHSRALFDTMLESGIDPQSELMVPVWNYAADKYMSKGRYDKAVQLMDEAIIQARKEAPSGTAVSTVQQPAGSVGVGGPVVQGTMGDAGSNAPVTAPVAGSPAGAGATPQQAGLLPNTAGQPTTTVATTPVDLTAPAAPVSKFRRAPKPMTVLEAANAAKAAQTQQTETQGSQAPAATQPVVDERQVVLQKIFGERNGDIIFDVIGMGMPEPEAAAKYGLSRAAIQKIAGATGAETRAARVAKAKTELGLTDEQIVAAFTPPEQDVLGTAVEREIFGQNKPAAISETEAIEGGLENIVNTEGAGTSAVEGFTKLQKDIDATLEALAVETDEAKLEELNAKLADQIEKVRAVEKRAQAEVRATAGKDTSTKVGEEDAVQEQSTAGVPVQPETQTGKGVGRQVRRAEKPASQGQVTVQGQAKGQVADKGQALWNSLAAKTPGLVPYDQLTKLEQGYLNDLAVRTNGKPVISKEMGLQQLLTKEPVTIEGETRIIDEQVTTQVAALPAPQVDRLEKHYGLARDSAEFLQKVQEDITKYVTQGAEAVAGAIRSIIKAMAEGVLAMGIVFNPNITKDAFTINVSKTFQQTIEVTQEVPEAAKAQMSTTAQAVYSAMAPVAMKSGKWFMVADKPNGMLHIFKGDGSHALSDPTLYGKDKGDVLATVSSLEGGAKITPAGKFTLKARASTYAGGQELILMESKDHTGYIAVHAADTSTPSENRLGRLASATTEDNRISYGCINTKHDTFINEIKPNISNLDGGMIFVVPDAQEQAAQMFAAESRTETRTEGGQGAAGSKASTIVGKEENLLFGKDGKAKKPYTSKQLLAELKDFIRADIPGRKLMVVDTIDDLLNDPDPKVRAVAQAIQKENAYGVATDGRAFLIADRINKGSGRAKFMHEVGAHLGLENLLSKPTYDRLVQQLKTWAKKKDGSIESVLAERATKRFESAQTTAAQQDNELLAYFIEEAMDAGIDPTAASKESGPLMDWFRTLWAAFKIAARKLGLKPETLNAQDVVNLAFGAARLEINGTWHGTAAAFRRFNHDFMSTGEGAQAYGWGSYFAQHFGIAKGYWSADVRRKKKANGEAPEGSLMRVDIPIADEDVLSWDEPLYKQPAILAKIEASISDILREDLEDQVGTDLADMTGDEFYRGLGFVEVRTGAVSEEFDVDDYNKRLSNAGFKEVVSKYLDEKLGIPALKFLDQNSRGNKDLVQVKLKQMQEILQEKQLEVEKATKEAAKWEALQDKAPPEQKDYARKTWLNAVAYRTSAEFQAEEIRQEIESLKQKVIGLENPTRNVVVFNEKNTFRVGSQAAADRQRMQFGKNAPTQGLIDRNISKLPKTAQKPVRTSVNTISDWARMASDRLVFTSDLINRAVSAGIKSAGQFQSLLAKRDTRARELERQVERVADMYALVEDKFKGDGPNSVNQFIFESTRTGKWGYGKYRNDQMGAAFDAFGTGSKAQEFIKAVFEHGDAMLAAKKRAVTEYTATEYDARIAAETDPAKKAALVKDKADDLKKFARLFQIREGIPYAPIKRFGNHVVIAKSREYLDAVAAKDSKLIRKLEQDPDHYHVSFTETKNEARNLAAQLEDQGFFSGGTVDFKERSEMEKTLFGSSDSLDAITRLRSMAEAKATGGDKNAAAMSRMVSDLYLQALAETSARKSEMRRRGVSGELDMLRSFAAQGRADANFVASVQYNPQIQDALQSMQREGNDSNGNLNRKTEIFNEIVRRYNSSMEVQASPVIAKVTRLSSIYYLATSPAYYLQNLTQPWMMSVPAMAGRHDYIKASAALTQAYTQLGGVMKSARLFDQQFDFSKVPSDVRDAIQELVNRGAIDIGMETELGEFKIEGDGAFTKGWNKVDKGLRIAVQKVESINRLSTAMAAYRLELAKTNDKEKALNYAERILTETHGDYSAFNAPRIFNTQLGKVALQFRKFQLIQLSFYAKLLKDAGFSTEEKRAATKALVYSLGHTGLLAGVMGLPGYAAIAWAIGALFGDDDDPLDVTAELRKFIGDEDMANLIMRGAPTLAGVDISGKVGAGNMLSIMPFSQADLTTRAGVIEAAGTLLGGAPVGMAARVADGLGLMLKGDWYRGMEQILPKGFGDAVKAYRIADQGMTRRNGDVLLPASEVSAADTFMQAIGVQPVKQTVAMERQQATVDMNQFYQDRSTKIKADYVRAIRAGESTAEARDAWVKLQEARVENGYTRQPLSELLRAPQSQTKRERQTVEGVQFNRTNKRFVEEQV